jgi:hypothetical protein
MSKKAAKKLTRRKRHEKLGELLVQNGIIPTELYPTSFEGGKQGFSGNLQSNGRLAKGGLPYGQINLIKGRGKTWRVEFKPYQWLIDEIERAGFKLTKGRKKSHGKSEKP